MSTPIAPVHRLATVPLFARLSTEVLDELARSARSRQYPQGQILCNEGDPGDSLIVLEAGQLRISRFTAIGDEVVLAVIAPPATVGELALLDGAPRDATVTAQRAVSVRLVPRAVFMDLLKREPLAVEGLLRTLAELVRAGNARHADFVGLDVLGRLAKWLLRHAAGDSDDAASIRAGTVVVMQCSQGELAAELGTTRSTLNRALHDFESLGLIALTGNRITLRKPDILRSYTS
jgi:CRP/FNR family cyclic AMP-dependent transcriptional regulator